MSAINRPSVYLILLFTFLLQTGKIFSQQQGKKHAVSGIITHTRSFCGGARPTDEMLEKFNTPQPLAGKKLYIRSGAVNNLKKRIIQTIVSDSTGHFTVYLPAGTYCLIQEPQIKKLNVEPYRKSQSQFITLDEACLKRWWSECLLTFTVGSSGRNDLKINFNAPCFTDGTPCLEYNGPMPP